MAPAAQTLFGLFGDFTAGWNSAAIREGTGNVEAGDEPDPSTWLGALNNSVQVTNVRGGARPDGVAVEAELTVGAGGFLGYPGGWPFVLIAMPDVEFRIQPFPGAGRTVRMFAALGPDGGPEVVLEGLPVEIRLPPELVEVHPDEPGDPAGNATVEVGEFEPGRLDDLKVIYRRGDSTSILVHVRLTVTADLQFDVQPAVPVSFGRCALSGIPCTAVHDFRLVPSPRFARDRLEWLRHDIEPWLPRHTGPNEGLFAVRSVDVDEKSGSVKDLVDWLNGHDEDRDPAAEFVLGDAIVPFRGPLWLPVPRHLTAGVRRNVLDPGSKQEVFAFEGAPVHAHISKDPPLAFIVENLYYRSLPSETVDEDLGLTFHAAIVRGKDGTAQRAYEIGLEEDYTLTVAYKRDFATPPTGPPVPGPGPDPATNSVVHWEIAQLVIVDVMAIRAGLSLGRLIGEGRAFLDSAILTVDLFVSMPPTGKDDHRGFRLRALNGEKAAFTLENVGWRLGGMHLEGVALPDGVIAYFGPVGFIISELGLIAEDGASYLSFSGGLLIPKPGGLAGALTVKRLRFRVEGDESQPRVKIDGFFLRLQSSSVLVEAGGYYSEREEPDGTSVSEFGFTGTVDFTVGVRHHRLGVDLVHGHRTSDIESFDYLMAQAIYAGQLGPIAGVELRGARLLYASNMLPKLRELDRESRELRYYRWYLDTDPLTVPGDRRLAAWQAADDSWAFGVGASASFVAFGRLVVLDLFVLGVRGPTERGLLVSARVFAMSNTKPIGFLAVEWDRQNGRISAVLAVDATPDKFMKNAPAWLAGVGGLQGTAFASNDPPTFAIGRLADQATWLAMRFEVDLWLRASLTIALCLEIVEGGPKGFALAVRIDGGIGKRGVVRLTYNAGWGIEVLVFTTGSSDYAAILFIEAGIRFVLFGFLRLGVSAGMEFRLVGASPSRGELTAQIRLETPWFLPDVTWRLDCQFGDLAPAELSTASPPMAGVGTTEAGSQQRLPAHVERFDPAWDGTGVAPVHSVVELRAPARPEAQRLANLAADVTLRPVATDATIAVEWSVPVNDRLGLGVGLATDLGNQQSGDLTLTYDLVGIAVRRRARFGDRSWKPLEDRIELGADFSDPGGVQLDGSFSPQVLNKTWDLDQQVAGRPAPKKLLLNGIAPYEFTSADVVADEELVRFSRGWPCCRPPDDKDLFELFHRVHWRDALAGVDLSGGSRFSDSTSTYRFVRAAWAHVAGYAGLAPNTIVAAARMDAPGVVARADLDEDAAFCSVRLAWPRGVRALLVMFDRAGKEVGRRDLGPGSAAFQSVMSGAQGPIRRFELWLLPPSPTGVAARAASTQTGSPVEVEEAAYVGLRDYLDLLVAQAACDGGAGGGYEGKGKLALLPNHEYELRFTTRVSVAHPSTAAEPADVDEFVYVRTKGLPGLNAVRRTGEELEPYVREAYAGGRGGVVYREEPVTLAFSEGFLVAVPLTVRPAGTAEEHTKLLQMQLVVEPNVATTAGTVFTSTGDDWVSTHHGAGTPPRPRPLPPWRGVPSRGTTAVTAMVSVDPLRHRLATVTQRAGVPCGPWDPRAVIGTVLVAPPQGDGDLWSAGAGFVARVREQGAGFVDRRPFEDGDETAFSATGTWTVADGTLAADGAGVAVFGEPDWDHLTVVAEIAPGSGPAGVGFGVTAPGAAPRGLFVTVEAGRLVIRRRDVDGVPAAELAAAELPAGNPGAPVVLQATAYDDRVRAAVGEVVVEADRDEVREGRMCLVAGGSALFGALQVRGLDLYAFPVTVSRFRAFGDHIGSWSGRLDVAGPDALGPGSTTATVAALWAARAAEVTAAMAPDAPAADRERVFAAWTGALGLPLKDDVTALELTRVAAGDRAQALLIESPEPLDFTGEVTAGLVFRKHVGGLPPVRPVASAQPPGPAGSLRDRLAGLVEAPVRPVRPVRPHRPLPGVDETILDVEVLPAGVHLTLHPALANAGELAVAVVDEGGTAQLFSGLVRPGFLPNQPALMRAHPQGPLPALPPGSDLLPELSGAVAGTVLLASRDLLDLLGRYRLPPGDVDITVPVQVLQSGDARRALVIPADGGPLEAGSHRLTLRLSRRRWPTTDPADTLNAYQGEATVPLDL